MPAEVLEPAHAEDLSAVTRWIESIVERSRIAPERVVGEAQKRGLAVSGADPVQQIRSLRKHEPEQLDRLASTYIRLATRRAGGQGFVTGVGGIYALPISIPADAWGVVANVSRVTSGVMLAYGFDAETDYGRDQLRLGIAAAFGIEKLAIVGGKKLLVREVGKQLANQVLKQAYREQLGPLTARQIAVSIGAQWALRNPAKVIPVLGGVVGGGLSASTVRVQGRRARAHYRSALEEWQENQRRAR